jgi:hypothetical protein
MAGAAVVTAQFIAGKATRDALFLANMRVTALPLMVAVTSILSIGLVLVSSRTLRRVPPAIFVPATFLISAALFLIEWAISAAAPAIAAQAAYLHISGLGPMLGSGFWLIATERFDPRTAKQRFGQIAGAGTLGGLIGGMLAERVAAVFSVGAMLPILAASNVLCAWQIQRLGMNSAADRPGSVELSTDLSLAPARSSLQVLGSAPYLRNLAALVLLGTVGAALADYVFKAQAAAALGSGDSLLRFFAIYYAGVSLITFAVQTAMSRVALERLGLAVTTGTPSAALLLGSIGGLLAPGLSSAMVARGGESVFRGSLFRAGYELLFTPLPSHEKRAAKSLIDVAVDRIGDALGAGIVVLVLMGPPNANGILLVVAGGCSLVALVVASRLSRGYVETLERSLLSRAVELELSDVQDTTTRTTMVRALGTLRGMQPTTEALRRPARSHLHAGAEHGEETRAAEFVRNLDVATLQIVALKSRDRDRVQRVLQGPEPLSAPLVPHVVPLLAWDAVAHDAVTALRRVAEEHVGQLTDALIDPNQDFAVRRRLARVFSVCVSQRATDALLLGLEDVRFEVRYECARSLAAVIEKNPRVVVNTGRVLAAVQGEVAVARRVWEGHRLLNDRDVREADLFVDEVVKDRADRSLAHVFTLLSLILPAEPLQIAFRGLHTDDQNLRGTALEYLESVLPPQIRERLWPFLEDTRPIKRSTRQREDILADLLRSNESIALNLAELQRRARSAPPRPEPARG